MNEFALLNIAYTHSPTFIELSSETNAPCHLTCYYTPKKPLRHHTERTIRGLTVPWGAYFCFVAWKSVEQNEAGDTLNHTFTIPDWQYCTTLWFTFRGTVASILSPSAGPILSHHHPGAGPQFVRLFPISDGWGGLYPFPSDGIHWNKVNDLFPDYDATYVHRRGGPFGFSIDTYQLPAWDYGYPISNVKFVGLLRRIASNPAGTYPTTVSLGIRIPPNNYYHNYTIASNSYIYKEDIYPVNPISGLAWTVSDLNQLQILVGLRYINMALWQGGFISGRCTQVYLEITRWT